MNLFPILPMGYRQVPIHVDCNHNLFTMSSNLPFIQVVGPINRRNSLSTQTVLRLRRYVVLVEGQTSIHRLLTLYHNLNRRYDSKVFTRWMIRRVSAISTRLHRDTIHVTSPVMRVKSHHAPAIVFLALINRYHPMDVGLSRYPFHRRLFRRLVYKVGSLIVSSRRLFPHFFNYLLRTFNLNRQVHRQLFARRVLANFRYDSNSKTIQLFIHYSSGNVSHSIFPSFLGDPVSFSTMLLLRDFYFYSHAIVRSGRVSFFIFVT